MRDKVLEFFWNLPEEKTEQFNQGFELYRKSEGKNMITERNYNVMGFSESSLSNLLYDLQKLHSISDLDIVMVGTPVIGLDEGTNTNTNTDLGQGTDLGQDTDLGGAGADDLDTEKAYASIREDYPFLNDEDCLNEFKILVADKITAWKIYEATHAKLQQIEAGELVVDDIEKAALAKKALDCFTENKLIHDELNAYKETGLILGVHPLFEKLKMQREIDVMTPDDLIKYKGSSAKYFTDNKKSLEKATKENDLEQIEVIKKRVADRGKKLALVNERLGIKN